MGVATIRIMVSLPLVVIVLSCAIGISMHTVTVCLLPLDDEVLHTRLATDRAFTKAYFTCFAERSFRSLENRGTVTGHLTALDWGLNSTVMGRKENLPLDRQRKHCNAARLALRESRKPKLVQDKLICWDQDHGSPLLLAAKCFLVFVVCKAVCMVDWSSVVAYLWHVLAHMWQGLVQRATAVFAYLWHVLAHMWQCFARMWQWLVPRATAGFACMWHMFARLWQCLARTWHKFTERAPAPRSIEYVARSLPDDLRWVCKPSIQDAAKEHGIENVSALWRTFKEQRGMH